MLLGTEIPLSDRPTPRDHHIVGELGLNKYWAGDKCLRCRGTGRVGRTQTDGIVACECLVKTVQRLGGPKLLALEHFLKQLKEERTSV